MAGTTTTATNSTISSACSPPQSSKEVAPFLKNLRAMLESESPAILRWTSDGRAFEILDLEQMSESVLPKYFKHAKYTSFQRQLNYFSFRKWTKSKAEVCTFSNAFFVRDQPSLSGHIRRKKSIPNHLKVPSANKARRSKRKQREEEEEEEVGAEQRFMSRHHSYQQQWQQQQHLLSMSPRSDMTIKLPTAGVIGAERLSFASPTEVYSSELAFPKLGYDDGMYQDSNVAAIEPIELDWVDTLYSSLSGVMTKGELDGAARMGIYCDPSDASSFDLLRL